MSKQQISKSKVVFSVEIELDRLRKLKFTNGALRKFRNTTGIDALALGDRFNEYVTELLWCGLSGQDPELECEQVDEMIGPSNLYYVVSKITEAWGLSMPDPEEEPIPLPPLPEFLPTS